MTADLGPARALIRRGQWLTALALIGVAVVIYLALVVAPVEARQGMAQKIFYIHVPSATMALFVSVPALGIASIMYLWLADPRLDRFAAASAEVATVFCGATLLTGPLWAKPIWGTWWTWDGRLTLTLFLFFLLLGYLTLRASLRDPHERGRFSSILGIMSLVLVPFIHLSVYLWRGLHPQPILLKPSKPSLPWEMLQVMLLGLAVFFVLYIGLVMLRYGIQLARDAEEAADAA